MFQFPGAPKTKGHENRQVGKTHGGFPKTHELYMELDVCDGIPHGPLFQHPPQRQEAGGARSDNGGQTAACPGESEFSGTEGSAGPVWAVGPRDPPRGRGGEGYLGGSGGICSSVGEVSMIRTSSRSM